MATEELEGPTQTVIGERPEDDGEERPPDQDPGDPGAPPGEGGDPGGGFGTAIDLPPGSTQAPAGPNSNNLPPPTVPNINFGDPPKARMRVYNRPKTMVMQMPYVLKGFEVVVVDQPPVPPEISFYPYKGINNRLLVLLNSSTGRFSAKPIAIQDGDVEEFENIYLTQTGHNKPFEEIDKIGFASDDRVDSYQLFRLDSMPTSYSSFADQIRTVLDPEYGVPASLVDVVVPNRKYYYCARSVDVHANTSNPTFVFEVQIIDNNGQIFLSQKIFTFEPIKNSFEKPGRRFVYIEPALQQIGLAEDVAAEQYTTHYPQPPGDSILGVADMKVWGKTFKVRLTSKKTGRKLDLNINFKNSGIVNQTE
jgi:hypothetical protein